MNVTKICINSTIWIKISKKILKDKSKLAIWLENDNLIFQVSIALTDMFCKLNELKLQLKSFDENMLRTHFKIKTLYQKLLY